MVHDIIFCDIHSCPPESLLFYWAFNDDIVSSTSTIYRFAFSVLKGLIGPAGVSGPAGPKGERVSICVCGFIFVLILN